MNNSRIVNELIEKANEWSYDEYNYKETGYTREQLYSQKLAELIIKECCNVVDAQNYYVYSGDVKKLILERFGVEP